MTTAIATVAADATLRAACIGHLVPVHDFTGVVHSVFARACNVAVQGALLTLVARRGAEAPTAIVLDDARADLQRLFCIGRSVHRDGDRLASAGVTVFLGRADVWSPSPPRGWQADACIRENVAWLDRMMSACPPLRTVLAHAVRHRAAALEAAAACCDVGAARTGVAALVGLGEGLTPSGDDFIVGLLAGLERCAAGATRARFLAALRRGVDAARFATTDVSAHQLKLASGGYFSAALIRLRDGLLAEPHAPDLAPALQHVLDFGATSGADTVRGLLAAFHAWPPGGSSEATP